MNPRNSPFFRLFLPFATGVALAGCFDTPIPYSNQFFAGLILLVCILAISRYRYRFRWVFGISLSVLLFVFGHVLTIGRHEMRLPQHFSTLQTPVNYFWAEVYEAPAIGGRIKIPVRVLAAGAGADSLEQAQGNVLLLLDSMPEGALINYGDRLLVRGRPLPTEPPKNPEVFNYQRYLHFQNLHHQCFVTSDSICISGTGHGSWIWRHAYRCRDQLLYLLRIHFPTDDEYAVASALLVGFKDDLSDEILSAYAETGSMHALAVSGTHVGMLYMGLVFFTQRLRLRGRARLIETGAVLLAIWAFTFLTGATASVLRASVMFSAYMVGKAFFRQSSAWNVLPASAFILLLINPYFLFDAGFQLSYAAVAGMIFFYPRFYKMFPPGPRWSDEVLKVLLVGVSAQLGTLPLTLFYFNQFPVYFWLAGWIVVLGGAVFLWGGVLLVLVNRASVTCAAYLGKILYWLVLWMNKAIFLIQKLPFSMVADVWIPAWVSVALYLALIFLGAMLVWRKGRWMAAFLGLMTALGMYRVHARGQKLNQRAIVVYQLPQKRRLIDFFDGNRVYALSDTLTPKQEAFAARPLRIASAIHEKIPIMLEAGLSFRAPNLVFEQPFIQFFEEKVVLIGPAFQPDTTHAPLHVEALILTQSPNVSLADCLKQFPATMLVFDASNSKRKVDRWRKECETAGWPFHDVRTQGAWMHHL